MRQRAAWPPARVCAPVRFPFECLLAELIRMPPAQLGRLLDRIIERLDERDGDADLEAELDCCSAGEDLGTRQRSKKFSRPRMVD